LPCPFGYSKRFSIIITTCHPSSFRPSLLALAPTVPAHIFPLTLTPEQLYRIPLSHPLSVDPCCPRERLFICEAASTICHSFWLPHSLVVSNSHYIPADSDSFSSLFISDLSLHSVAVVIGFHLHCGSPDPAPYRPRSTNFGG
jgi:hypothetical protein